jgi:hypothetical protein
MRHRILLTLVAFVVASAVAGGGAGIAAGTHHHHAHRLKAPRNAPAAGVTGMSGASGSGHCPGM